ncbi:MAG: hypothetical protein ACTTJH_06310 [Bacteroidales bacterium]
MCALPDSSGRGYRLDMNKEGNSIGLIEPIYYNNDKNYQESIPVNPVMR